MSHLKPQIVLCICTYRRPDGLAKLLNALPALHDSDDMIVVVSDNDAGNNDNGRLSARCRFRLYTPQNVPAQNTPKAQLAQDAQ